MAGRTPVCPDSNTVLKRRGEGDTTAKAIPTSRTTHWVEPCPIIRRTGRLSSYRFAAIAALTGVDLLMRTFYLSGLLLLAGPILAQVPAAAPGPLAPLTVEKIMRDPAQWLGTSPSGVYWGEDGRHL